MRRIQSLALTAILVLAAPAAWAVTFDFAAAGAALERGYSIFNMTESGLTVTATAIDSEVGDSDSFVYLDGLLGPLPSGMGVCKGLDGGNQCVPSDDDNVTAGETLSLAFSGEGEEALPVRIDSIVFRNADHGDGYRDALIDIAVGGGSFDQYSLVHMFTPSFPLAGVFAPSFSFRFNNDQFYISSMDVTPEPPGEPIPEPATLSLLGTGLLAAGWRARGRRRGQK